MKLLIRREPRSAPDLSIILADWSCRESFHVLDCLSRQSVPRDRYDLLWIEFYDRQPEELQRRAFPGPAGEPGPLDTWALLEMPRACVHHKHLIYNAGIALARGRIVCICDSDAIVDERFVESIVSAFADHSPIVLHLDEIRNDNRRFYPYNSPAIDDVTSPGCVNWVNRRPAGLWDEIDPLHSRNYGACMAARRKDLIAIGGADEHLDYLGHICGPYEMTFRLVNFGRRELWHQEEWLYHVWHPGQDGRDNYMGPSDGRNMSSPALAVKASRRVMPLKENLAIRLMRTTGREQLSESEVAGSLVDDHRRRQWKNSPPQQGLIVGAKRLAPKDRRPSRSAMIVLACMALGRVFGQAREKIRLRRRIAQTPAQGRDGSLPVRIAPKGVRFLSFLKRCWDYEKYVIAQCWRTVKVLAGMGTKSLCLYGVGHEARVLEVLCGQAGIAIAAVAGWDGYVGGRRTHAQPLGQETLAQRNEIVLVADMVNIDEKIARLVDLGVKRERIWVLR